MCKHASSRVVNILLRTHTYSGGRQNLSSTTQSNITHNPNHSITCTNTTMTAASSPSTTISVLSISQLLRSFLLCVDDSVLPPGGQCSPGHECVCCFLAGRRHDWIPAKTWNPHLHIPSIRRHFLSAAGPFPHRSGLAGEAVESLLLPRFYVLD